MAFPSSASLFKYLLTNNGSNSTSGPFVTVRTLLYCTALCMALAVFTCTLWADDCIREGDIVGITVMGTPNLILGSFKAASELLDARGPSKHI